VDPWTPESDQLAEELQLTLDRLKRVHRRERWVMGGVAVGVGVLLVIHGLTSNTAALLGALALLGLIYLRLRLRPRQHALAEIKAKLQYLDPRCPACAYSLRYLRDLRCPECGRRVQLPSAERIDVVVAGGRVTVAQASVESDMGYIVLLIMFVLALGLGGTFGAAAGVGSMAVPPLVFIVIQAVQRRRRAKSTKPKIICEECGQLAELHDNECANCAAPLLAEHVYVRPGLRGNFDPRLYNSKAQVFSAALICLMVALLALAIPEVDRHRLLPFNILPMLFVVQLPLVVLSLCVLRLDTRLRSKERLAAFDHALAPLCHHCLGSLKGAPAGGNCAHCGKSYSAVQIAGGS
jgi:predicted amidophosphoribosyltransferase